MRSPCTRGIVLNTIAEHFPEWDAIPALELKAKQLAEIDAEKIQLDVKRQRMEHKWFENRTTAEHFQATSNPAVLTHCPRVFLNDLEKSIAEEIKNRENEILFCLNSFFFNIPIEKS